MTFFLSASLFQADAAWLLFLLISFTLSILSTSAVPDTTEPQNGFMLEGLLEVIYSNPLLPWAGTSLDFSKPHSAWIWTLASSNCSSQDCLKTPFYNAWMAFTYPASVLCQAGFSLSRPCFFYQSLYCTYLSLLLFLPSKAFQYHLVIPTLFRGSLFYLSSIYYLISLS